MAYKSGELQLVGSAPELDEFGDRREVMDSRGDYENLRNGVYLPHSCDEWVIGGPEQIRALMADLATALELLQ